MLNFYYQITIKQKTHEQKQILYVSHYSLVTPARFERAVFDLGGRCIILLCYGALCNYSNIIAQKSFSGKSFCEALLSLIALATTHIAALLSMCYNNFNNNKILNIKSNSAPLVHKASFSSSLLLPKIVNDFTPYRRSI